MTDPVAESIHNAIMNHVKDTLDDAFDQVTDTRLKPGVIKLGPLQGDPLDPDDARITIMIFENDPDEKDTFDWCDKPASSEYGGLEIGGGITWLRRFTLKADCLFELSREDLDTARRIAGALKVKIEDILLKMSFSGIAVDDEYVSRGVIGYGLQSTMRQGGGPPDAYQFKLKMRFEVLTSRTGVLT
jgi:hypothetical protein